MAEKFKNRLKEIEKKAELNMVRAVNHGLRKGKTALIRLVRSEVRMKHRDVASLINVSQRANRTNPQGVLKTKFKPQGLIKFGAVKVNSPRSGVKVKVTQTSLGSVVEGAFIRGTGNNKRVVIRRSSGKLKTLYSASAEQVVRNNFPKIASQMETLVKDEFIRLTRAGI